MKENQHISHLDSWPEAEKMLNRHFRRRKTVLWTSLLLICGALISIPAYFLTDDAGSSVSLPSSKVPATVDDVNHVSELQQFSQATGMQEISKPETVIAEKQSENISNQASSNSFNKKLHAGTSVESGTNTNAVDRAPTGTFRQSDKVTPPVNDYIASLDLLYFRPDSRVSTGLNSSFNLPVNNSYRTGSQLIFTVYGGQNYIMRELSGDVNNSEFIKRRNDEEREIIAPIAGFSVGKEKDRFIIRAGFALSVFGEETRYSSYSYQQSLVENGNWHTYMTSYTDIDTAYITGNPFYLESTQYRLDSSFNSVVDTVTEYRPDPTIAERNGTNRYYYAEFPVEASVRFGKRRLQYGFSAGIAPGVLMKSESTYLRADMSGVEEAGRHSMNTFSLSGLVSFDVVYHLHPQWAVMLRPQYRRQFTSVFKDDTGISQKYSSAGLLFGVAYKIGKD